MPTEIATDIKVLAEFDQGSIKPRVFMWEKRRHNVSQVHAAWSEREGIHRVHYFSVQTQEDGVNSYELEFHPGKLKWRLLRIYTDRG